MKISNVQHYKGYHIKIYEQKPDKEWVTWQLLDDQDEAEFPYNAYGQYGYEVSDILGKVLDSDFKAIGDEESCLDNAYSDINLIIKNRGIYE